MSALRSFTRGELQRFDGLDKPQILIAYRDVVYDVSDCPKWWTGMHEGLHWAGQDLSDALGGAPHAEEVFTRPCVRVVGRLIERPKQSD